MLRRRFSRVLPGLALAGTLPGAGHAADPEDTADYITLPAPLPVTLPPGRVVEVIEFFWYECPHCHAMEPVLDAWRAALPADVAFRPLPVGWTSRHQPGQRLFFALEALGLREALHRKVYVAIHEQRRRLRSPREMADFVVEHGGDGARLLALLDAPETTERMAAADRLADAYGIDATPSFGVHGRFRTSSEQAGGRARALAVVDFLVQRVRRGG